MSHGEENEMKKISDALRRDRENEPKDKVHYKIFKIEKDEKTGEEKKTTMTKFWAKNDDEALAELEKYRKDAGDQDAYYYSTTGYYVGNTLDDDGNIRKYDSFEEMMEADNEKESFFSKIWDSISLEASCLWSKIKDFWWYGAKDLIFWLKTKHNRNESWSLDCHLLDDIIFNLPLLIKNKNGVPTKFCCKARAELNKNDPAFDLEKSFEKNPSSDEKEMELAEKLWNEELEKGLLYAKLYQFYSDYGITEDEEFEKKWKSTIPYKPGTYNDIDYVKLVELEDKYWNSLWNWIKENGRNLWD